MQSQQCLTLQRLVVPSSTRPVQGPAARQPFKAAFKQARSVHLRPRVQRVSITGGRGVCGAWSVCGGMSPYCTHMLDLLATCIYCSCLSRG